MSVKKKKDIIESEVTKNDTELIEKEGNKIDKVYEQVDSLRDEDEYHRESIYASKDIDIPGKLPKNKTVKTQVRVYKSSGEVEDVSPAELKNLIKNSKGIQRIEIQKVGLTEAKKIAFDFDEDGKRKDKVIIRGDALKRSTKISNQEENNKYLEEEDLLKIDNILEDDESKEIEVENEEVIKENAKKSVQLKINNDAPNSHLRITQNVENDEESKQLTYAKHTLTKKKGKFHNGYYYRAKNHVELFKTGSSYLKDFKEGMKSFAFSSIGCKEAREKSVFGICSFFNYHSNVQMAVVTSDFDNTFYSDFVNNYQTDSRPVFDEDLTYKVYQTKGFEVVDFNEFKKISRKIKNYDFEEFIENFVDGYDLVLWDMPELEVMDSNKELYFPIIRVLDNVTLIIASKASLLKEINNLIDYFKRYQIDIKGVLFDNSATTSKKKKEAA